MEIKTCEEYVINELERVRNELFLTQNKLEEVKEQINQYNENPSMFFKGDFVHILEKKGVYYRVNAAYSHSIKESIEDGTLTKKQIKNFLKNENEDFLSIEVGDKNRWSRDCIGKIDEYDYDFISVKDGKTYVIKFSYPSIYEANVDDIWLNEEDAKRELVKQVKETLQGILNDLKEDKDDNE